MPMKLPRKPDAQKMTAVHGNLERACAICGKEVKRGNEAGDLHVAPGWVAIVPETIADIDRSFTRPIGRECFANHPEIAPYVVRAHKEATV